MSNKDYYAPVLAHLIYPLSQRLQGRDFHAAMRAAVGIQHLKNEELRKLQFGKIQGLVEHAYRYVPYYRELFEEINMEPGDLKVWEDFQKIPILTKNQLRKNEAQLLSTNCEKRLKPVPTSGSTGTPIKIYVSQRAALAANISRIRSLKWWGINLGDREFRISSTGLSFISGWKKYYDERITSPIKNRLMNRIKRSAFTMTPPKLNEYWEALLRSSPKYLFGFPSAFAIFADFINKKGYDGRAAKIKLVVTTGEILHEWQEELIMKTFGCPVANEYGSTEAGVIAYSHPCGGMHIMDDHVIVEFVPFDSSETYKQVIVTNLENLDFPIIRYKLGDAVTAFQAEHNCELGIGFSLLEGLMGRNQDFVRLTSGRIVHGNYFHSLIKLVRGVRQYQVIQTKPDLFELFIIPEEDTINIEQQIDIQKIVSDHLEGSTIVINIVDKIPKDPSGKLRFVRSEIE